MNLRLRSIDQWVIVSAEGRLDSLNYDLIEFRLKTLMRMGYVFIGLDLTKATFMNIATLALTVTTAMALKDLKGELAVVAANSEIKANLAEFGGNYIRFVNAVNDLTMATHGRDR